MNTKDLLEKVYNGNILSREEAKTIFSSIFKGEVEAIQLAALLGAMKARSEHPDEIAGAALSMREFACDPGLGNDVQFDTCGTGGDGKHSFNISSAVAIVLNSMGFKIAKHGNRSVSSLSGSADFYEKLGIPVSISPEKAADYYKKTGFVFLFAPNYHPAMKYAVPVRKALASRTIFNYLGPLTNPAGVKRQMIGVYNKEFLPLYADAAKSLNYEKLTLYSSEDGMDEVSPYAETHVVQIAGTSEKHITIDPSPYITPEEADTIPCSLDAGGNAGLFTEMLDKKNDAPLVRFISLNTALALLTLDFNTDFDSCYQAAHNHLLSGKVSDTLAKLREAV